MSYKLEELRAPGMEQNFRTVEGQVRQPATNDAPASLESSKAPSKFPITQPLPKPKEIKQKQECHSTMVDKAKEILIITFMALGGIAAIAVVIRGIQFLFSI